MSRTARHRSRTDPAEPQRSRRGGRAGARTGVDRPGAAPAPSGGADSHGRFDLWFPLGFAALVVIAALLVQRLWFPIGDTGVETDFYGDMAVAARELTRGNFSVTQYPYKGPVYPIVLALAHTVVGDWYRSGVALNALFAGAFIIVLYRLLRRVWNRPVAVAATVSVALVFEFFLLAHKASSDVLFFVLCVVAMERIVAVSPSWSAVCGAAVASALAFLTRYNGVFLVVGVLGTILLLDPAGVSRRRRAIRAAVYLGIFLAVCAPWFAVTYAETGELLSTRNIENVVRNLYEETNPPDERLTSMRDVVVHDPGRFVGRYLANIAGHFWRDMNGTLGIEAGILVMLGLLRLFVVRPSRRQWSILLFAAVYFLLQCAVFHLRRFSIPLTPVYYAVGFSVLFGSGTLERSRLGKAIERTCDAPVRRIRALWNRALMGRGGGAGSAEREKRRGRRDLTFGRTATIAVIATLVAFQLVRIVRHERMYHARRPLFVEDVARFLGQPSMRIRQGARPVVMARKPHVAFYADMAYQQYPQEFISALQFLEFAVDRDVDYIVYSVIEQEHFPEAKFLKTLDIAPGVQRIYATEEAYVYRLADWLDIDDPAGQAVLRELEARLSEAERAGNVEAVAKNCFNIGELHALNGDWDRKIEYLERAVAALEAVPDSDWRFEQIALMRINLAEAHLVTGEYERGIAALEAVMPRLDAEGSAGYRAGAHIMLSKLNEELGRIEEARRHLVIVLGVYESEGNVEGAGAARKAMEVLDEDK